MDFDELYDKINSIMDLKECYMLFNVTTSSMFLKFARDELNSNEDESKQDELNARYNFALYVSNFVGSRNVFIDLNKGMYGQYMDENDITEFYSVLCKYDTLNSITKNK